MLLQVNVCVDDILLAAGHFVTKLSIVMQLYELVCRVNNFVCYLQGQGHSEGLYDQNMTLSTISSELLILWQINLV